MNNNIYGYIYCITNKINNKKYIGLTTQRLQSRFSQHKKQPTNSHLKNSFNKYGIDNFTFSEIDFAVNKEDLEEKEKYYIDLYNTLSREYGYNIRDGGETYVMGEETKQKLRDANLGKVIDKDVKNKISKSLKGRPSPMRGRHHRDDSLKKMSKVRMGEKNHFYGKSHTEDTKNKIGIKNKGNTHWLGKKHTEDTKIKISKANKGKVSPRKGVVLSEETKLKISESKKGTQAGENNPMYGVKKATKICPYCNRDIDVSNYKRWHGSNCKLNQ